MKDKHIKVHMDIAERWAQESYARRLKVGCIIVKGTRTISVGYNGTPEGWDNNCEDEELHYVPDSSFPTGIDEQVKLVTKPEVIHAEANAIAKLAKYGESSLGATAFITHAPCLECAKTMAVSGISDVYYKNSYRDTSGIDHLKKCGVNVTKVEETNEKNKDRMP